MAIPRLSETEMCAGRLIIDRCNRQAPAFPKERITRDPATPGALSRCLCFLSRLVCEYQIPQTRFDVGATTARQEGA
jgi:hypothetical protein